MRKIVFILTILFVCSAQAQKRKPAQQQPQLPKITIEEALANYDFAAAEALLNNEIATLKKKKQSTEEAEQRLQDIHRQQMKLNAVERVVFIDSIKVKRDQVLKHITLNPECGSLHRFADFFHTQDTLDCTVFKSQMGDQIIYSQANAQLGIDLYMRDVYGDGTMSQPIFLTGISNSETNQNYPFMLTDGATIYFASQGSESLGGYDIFMSRYDADERRFLTAENIGMPFNSPANDYLFVIDESNNIGWFVTDRNCHEDTVCIYAFIPNETRRIYIPEETENERLRNLARITSIQDTWTDEQAVRAAQFRMRNARQGMSGETASSDFTFVVNDNKVYRSANEFQSPQAKQLTKNWQQAREELRKVKATLERLRKSYHDGTPAQRQQLASEILTLEKNEESLTTQIAKTENEIRKAELGL